MATKKTAAADFATFELVPVHEQMKGVRAQALFLRECIEAIVAEEPDDHADDCHCPICVARYALSVTSGLGHG